MKPLNYNMGNACKVLMNQYRSDKYSGIHCLPLVPFAFLVNLVKNYETIDTKNISYWLTALLCINYFFVTIHWIKIKNFYSITSAISLIIISFAFAFSSNYLLSLDSIYLIFIFGLLSNYFYIKTIDNLPNIFKSSFSFGELLIVSQASVAYLSTAIGCAVTKFLGSQNYRIFCSQCLPNHVIQIIFVGISLMIISLLLVFWMTKEKHWIRSIPISDLLILSIIIICTYIALIYILESEPLVWLINFLLYNQNRRKLIVIWILIMIITLIFTSCYAIVAKRRATTITRKFFHVSISLVYLIGLKNDLKLLIFSSAVILALFIVIEIIRIKKFAFGQTIELIFKMFRDEKDVGYLTLTHTYLLVGCSLPLWIYPFDEIRSPLAIASGIVTVGFGDTAASIGGSLLGRHYWRGSRKTYEGTFFAIIAQLISSLIIYRYLMPNSFISLFTISILSLISTIVALIEAKISQIDNLVLPLYYYILIRIFLH